jgi:hypothetical protein
VESAAVSGSEVTLLFDPNITGSSDLELEDQVTGGVRGVDLAWNGSGTGFVNEVVCTVFTSTGVCPSADQLAVLNVNSSGAFATQWRDDIDSWRSRFGGFRIVSIRSLDLQEY